MPQFWFSSGVAQIVNMYKVSSYAIFMYKPTVNKTVALVRNKLFDSN